MTAHLPPADRPDTAHHCTVLTTPWGDSYSGLLRVNATCSCLHWQAEGVVNPWAPAYDPDRLPVRLRTLHRDHQADVLLDTHLATTTTSTGGTAYGAEGAA